MSVDLGCGRICSFACFYGNKTGFLTSFKYKAPCFSLSKSQRCETPGCNIGARSLPPTLQNQSHHKQAGREDEISVAERADEERRGKKSGALWGLFPPSLAVRRQNILSGGGEFTFSESLRLLRPPSWSHMLTVDHMHPHMRVHSLEHGSDHWRLSAMTAASRPLSRMSCYPHWEMASTSLLNSIISLLSNWPSRPFSDWDRLWSTFGHGTPRHIWTQNLSSFWQHGQIRERDVHPKVQEDQEWWNSHRKPKFTSHLKLNINKYSVSWPVIFASKLNL